MEKARESECFKRIMVSRVRSIGSEIRGSRDVCSDQMYVVGVSLPLAD